MMVQAGWGAAGLLVLAMSHMPVAAQSPTIPVDDSYTVSSRFLANQAAHPDYRLPVLTTVAGQQILFDRLYKTVGGRELHSDVFLPPAETGSGQAIVLVHGGGWHSGNKSNFYSMANLLAQRGYVVVLPEFRLAPEAGYPAGVIDVNDAIRWTMSQAAEFGIDPQRVAIGGESSGGQMAALVAYTGGSTLFSGGSDRAPSVNALIDIDGVIDFTTPLALANENRNDATPAARWLGGSWEQAPDRWREASAATHVGPNSPATLVISGERDRFTAGMEKVLPILAAHGIPHHHAHFADQPHTFWLFQPYTSQVVAEIDTFLQDLQPAQTAAP
ncbi:alpha/beta hydrolase [Croceibacterium sp. TMG7-5b_MA50]|uniref:alpha/beta hydrolase n=1 Tax=Croceibacterium sp. TMG7-5b_MA50 TaxID=3121290 RepID=UPI00322190D5